jgi:Protein of unknown function (DUF1580)
MIDLATEKVYPLKQLLGRIPPGRSGSRTHLSTVLRWILDGAKGPDGQLVRFEALRIGGRWVSSYEAIQRFAERLTPQSSGDGPGSATAPPRTPNARHRAGEQAGRELEILGV